MQGCLIFIDDESHEQTQHGWLRRNSNYLGSRILDLGLHQRLKIHQEKNQYWVQVSVFFMNEVFLFQILILFSFPDATLIQRYSFSENEKWNIISIHQLVFKLYILKCTFYLSLWVKWHLRDLLILPISKLNSRNNKHKNCLLCYYAKPSMDIPWSVY